MLFALTMVRWRNFSADLISQLDESFLSTDASSISHFFTRSS